MPDNKLTFALPSKGAIADPTYNFLRVAGLKVHKPNARQYVGSLPSLDDVDILFQRVKDIVYKVSDGTAQLGITGYDIVKENPHEELVVIHDRLGYGHCQLIVAVPETWIDVTTLPDLLDVSLDFREKKQRNIRIATTYPNLTRAFLHRNGIHYFNIVKAEGAIEAAPTIGYADFVVDLTQTGTTLRENHLKILNDGIILDSQACLIGNRTVIANNPYYLRLLEIILDRIDSAMIGRKYAQIAANMSGQDMKDVGDKLTANPITVGLQGPTISPIYSPEHAENWFAITIIVEKHNLFDAVNYLRASGSEQIVTSAVDAIYMSESHTYRQILQEFS